MSNVFLWTPTHGHTDVGWQAKTCIHQLYTDTGWCLNDFARTMTNRDGWCERESRKSIQSPHTDDDDDDDDNDDLDDKSLCQEVKQTPVGTAWLIWILEYFTVHYLIY